MLEETFGRDVVFLLAEAAALPEGLTTAAASVGVASGGILSALELRRALEEGLDEVIVTVDATAEVLLLMLLMLMLLANSGIRLVYVLIAALRTRRWS